MADDLGTGRVARDGPHPPTTRGTSERPSGREWIAFGVPGLSLVLLGAALALWLGGGGGVDMAATPIELAPSVSAIGAFVLWRRPRHRISIVIAATGLWFSLVALSTAALGFAVTHPGLSGVVQQAALAIAWSATALSLPWMLLVLWFPDGRFTRPAWRRCFAAAALVAPLMAIAGYLFGPPGTLPDILAGAAVPAHLGGPFAASDHRFVSGLADMLLALPLVALLALFDRYRRSAVAVRQQIRWLLVATATTAVASGVAAGLEQAPAAWHTVGLVLSAMVQPLPTLAIAVAILRYRLWDIDVVVSKAVVTTVLWALLSVLFVVPALASGLLVGGSGTLAAVAAALLVTLLFQPVRQRTERAVEARVYRARRRGAQQLARFGESLRTEVDVSELGERVTATVRDGLGVPWAALWLHLRTDGGSALRVRGATGIDLPAGAMLSNEQAGLLRSRPGVASSSTLPAELRQLLPIDSAVIVPLVAGGELIGLIACGERPAEPFTEADRELLARSAGECALGLRGMRLDAELRAKLAEIERQAEELRISRQRLAAAQDEERRRIERNLHDGVQQQLVSLAVRIRRLTATLDPERRRGWQEVVDDAEDAVFALQDIARGIFPSVLTDQGLAVALRAHAGRLPLAVRVEIEPSLADRRFAPEAEAALYFVALEALTNIQKHASEAHASIGLHGADNGRHLVLEVRDDGPGLPDRRGGEGSGLQNMHDRMAAVGGTLYIDSRPGAGTWVRAGLPLPAPVIQLHRADADSRR